MEEALLRESLEAPAATTAGSTHRWEGAQVGRARSVIRLSIHRSDSLGSLVEDAMVTMTQRVFFQHDFSGFSNELGHHQNEKIRLRVAMLNASNSKSWPWTGPGVDFRNLHFGFTLFKRKLLLTAM